MKTVLRYGWLAHKYYIFDCQTCRCLFVEDNREKWNTEIRRRYNWDKQLYDVRSVRIECRCPECNGLATAIEVDKETYMRNIKEKTKEALPMEMMNGGSPCDP